jgi:MFS family permease
MLRHERRAANPDSALRLLCVRDISRINFDGVFLKATQEGIVGAAFTIGFLISAPFVALFSERWHRPKLLAFCVFAWSVATVTSGAATNLTILIISRAIVGIGEAGALVIGPALVADYAPPRIRGKMLALFYLGIPIGSGIGFLLGGNLGETVWQLSEGAKAIDGWRVALYAAGLPGIVVTVIIALLHDPDRGVHDVEHAGHGSGLDIRKLKGYGELFRSRVFVYCVLALTAVAFASQPLMFWVTEFFTEYHQQELSAATGRVAPIIAIGGLLGSIIAGDLGDRLIQNDKRAYLWLAATATFLSLPCIYIGLYSRVDWIAMPALFFGTFFILGLNPLINTQIANSVPPQKRAAAFGVTIMTMHILGDMISFPLFGYLDEHVFESITQTMVFIPLALVFTGALCIFGARHIVHESIPAAPSADGETRES